MSSNDELIDVDGMLAHVGDFGRYQLILMLLFSIINILSAFHYFGQTFISVTPDFKCNIQLFNENENVSIATKCSVDILENDTVKNIPCVTGFIYNKTNTYGYVSIVEELDWVCSDAWKPALGQSVFFVGSVLGSLIFGILADNIGRLHVLVTSNMLAFFGNILTLLSSNVTVFAMSRFLAGVATDSNFVMMYIIVMEYIRPSLRTMGLNICIGVFYCLSCMAVPWAAVLTTNWHFFLIVISVPHLLVLFFYFLVPESAQWLISKGKTEQAIECFTRIAAINRRKIDPMAIESLKRYCVKHVEAGKQKSENIFGLLKTPNLRRKTLILVLKSMIMTLCYDAISRNVNGSGYSPFVVFTATSSTILPACLFILAVQDKVGRKALASGALLLSGIFTACSGMLQAFLTSPEGSTIILLAIIARLGINVAYNSGHQYAVELIPTVVRGQGVSAIHVAGYAASFFSPQILYLYDFWSPLPQVLLSALLIVGAVACLFLPETLNRTLPVTLQDGEDFGEDERIFEFACCKVTTESTMALHTSEFRRYNVESGT